ncbi:hypothetical protein J45TS6_29080 [Paenibacillus sp. J45TS6]|uniref:hypothetical protein n=1 Tax=Paenibacillus sp. J45TS6 TaxID=2807196 RepID=UPI001B085F26|nr:hypothetical protein [Paenibacillus sp. J45TS6]GIP44449.1 hypothetical protein J45TS6_29080 [Paenibacillus sp. J45TS6]
MKKRFKYIVIALLSVTLIATTAIVYSNNQESAADPYKQITYLSANSLKLQDVDKLDEYVELIVVGYATEDFSDREHNVEVYADNYLQDFSTRTTIKIDKIIKKPTDFPEDQKELTIIEPVSLHEGEKFTVGNYIELKKDEPSVIFLMKNSFGDYSLVNDNLGKIMLTDEEPKAPLQALTTSELSEYNTFRNSVLEKYGLNAQQ